MTDQRNIFEGFAYIVAVTAATIALTFVSHVAAGVEDVLSVLPGLGLIAAVVLIGFFLTHVIPSKLPALFWVSIVAMAAGFPGAPGSTWFLEQVSKISFVATITPVLAFASLGLRKDDITTFRKNGAQIALIAIFVFLGTFLGSALIAQLVIVATGA